MVLNVIFGFSQEKKNSPGETKTDFKNRMAWFKKARYGKFIHFGLYSQPGGIYNSDDSGRYAEWIPSNAQIPGEEYVKLFDTWNPNGFDAKKIVAGKRA